MLKTFETQEGQLRLVLAFDDRDQEAREIIVEERLPLQIVGTYCYFHQDFLEFLFGWPPDCLAACKCEGNELFQHVFDDNFKRILVRNDDLYEFYEFVHRNLITQPTTDYC